MATLRERKSLKNSTNSPIADKESNESVELRHPNHASSNFVTNLIRKSFKLFGEFCSTQPWEVLVTALYITRIILVLCNDRADSERKKWVQNITWIGCVIVPLLHLTYRFKKVNRIDSKPIFLIALAYFIVTSALYACIVWLSDTSLWDGWFLMPLLIDMQKVTRMAQFALSSSNSRRIQENIAHGMYVLAPTLSLDSVGKILLFGLGWQTGFPEFRLDAWYAVISVIANLIVYVIFYPVGLAIMLDMTIVDGRPTWDVRHIINTLPGEEGQSPIVHRIKVLAISFLIIIHIVCWPNLDSTSDLFPTNFVKFFLILTVVVLFIRYLFYEDMDEAKEMRKTYIEELTRKFAEDREQDRASNISTDTDDGIGSVSSNSNKALPPASGDDSSIESGWSQVGPLTFTVPGAPDVKDQEIQTMSPKCIFTPDSSDSEFSNEEDTDNDYTWEEPRDLEECKTIFDSSPFGAKLLNDVEILNLIEAKHIRLHALETSLNDVMRGVKIRRRYLESQYKGNVGRLPYKNYNYDQVMGACCESVIGYMPIPVGIAGPLKLDGKLVNVPMATTEGCLVASVNRGCSALRENGVTSQITADGMTRGPVVRFRNIVEATDARLWMEDPTNFQEIKTYFDSTSRFAKLKKLKICSSGRQLFIRFIASTGDAMGMNMLSKGTERAMKYIKEVFPDMDLISLSGNYCTDKKPAAINWLDGRGKSVICEAFISRDIVSRVLKTTPESLVELNLSKNLVGSAMSGSIGGFNAQAANVVTAIYIATGQDAAQNIASSNCITQMEVRNEDLYITVTMPSIEVGTVGGGTILDPQGACLDMLGVRGSHPTVQGQNASQLARIVCATVLAGELSLMSALAAGHLVRSHLRHNRSTINVAGCINLSSPSKLGIPSASDGEIIKLAHKSREAQEKNLR